MLKSEDRSVRGLLSQSANHYMLLTTANHAHGKDGVVRHLWVSIVREFAKGVQNIESRVGDGDESQGERHCSPQGRLTVTQLMPETRERHTQTQKERDCFFGQVQKLCRRKYCS